MSPHVFAEACLLGRSKLPRPKHVFISVADHFEPDHGGASPRLQQERVQRWVEHYPALASRCNDSRGRPPQHTFFYPIECYVDKHLEQLSGLVHSGFGDVEVHLHHDGDNAGSMRDLLIESVSRMHGRHGLLHRDSEGLIRYGFVHGNWAINNSHPTGHHCGVENELAVLRETGCYADFTMPAAPHPAQTKTINKIYYASTLSNDPRAHDQGPDATTSSSSPDASLLMIQGPLVVYQNGWFRKPRVENGNVCLTQPLSINRLTNWLKSRVAVQGQPDWQFIKLHTHGCNEANIDYWLGGQTNEFHQDLREAADELGFNYYYVTCREMADLVKQAESGFDSPDFEVL
ncbi:hypothetical protein LOC67_03035 [Stieleria sp. JC731]|nr:hypothetical protein [Stieleria sp. JC731]